MDEDQLRTVGDRAVLVAAAAPAGFASQIRSAAAHHGVALREVVPGARNVLVELAEAADRDSLRTLLAELVEDPVAQPVGDEITIGVRFDGADLAWAAQACALPADGLVELITDTTLTAAFCGFAPGFAYLTGLPSRLSLARRESPRTEVPAGSFAVVGEYAAIYPRASPGGWRLLGRTDQVMFDESREPAARISPGMRVRILAVD